MLVCTFLFPFIMSPWDTEYVHAYRLQKPTFISFKRGHQWFSSLPSLLLFFPLSVSSLSTSIFTLHILLCRWRWVIVVTVMLLIDEGELSSGLQRETLEDTGAAIHPPSSLHTPKLSLHTLWCKLELRSALVLNQYTVASWCTLEGIANLLQLWFFFFSFFWKKYSVYNPCGKFVNDM